MLDPGNITGRGFSHVGMSPVKPAWTSVDGSFLFRHAGIGKPMTLSKSLPCLVTDSSLMTWRHWTKSRSLQILLSSVHRGHKCTGDYQEGEGVGKDGTLVVMCLLG